MVHHYQFDEVRNMVEDFEQSVYLEGYRDGAAAAPFWNRFYGVMLAALMFALGLWIGYLV